MASKVVYLIKTVSIFNAFATASAMLMSIQI